MTDVELDQVAGQLIDEAITAGRLPQHPAAETLARIAALIRPVLHPVPRRRRRGEVVSDTPN